MTFKFSQRSLDNMKGVHPDLVKVVHRALELTPVDFVVIEGLRSRQRQEELFRKGFSKTLNSRHLTGHAVDIVPLPVDWKNIEPFRRLAQAMKAAASELDVPIVWGGDWKGWDNPHYELDRKTYK